MSVSSRTSSPSSEASTTTVRAAETPVHEDFQTPEEPLTSPAAETSVQLHLKCSPVSPDNAQNGNSNICVEFSSGNKARVKVKALSSPTNGVKDTEVKLIGADVVTDGNAKSPTYL